MTSREKKYVLRHYENYYRLISLLKKESNEVLQWEHTVALHGAEIKHSPFRALQFNYKNSNQQMHTILLTSKYTIRQFQNISGLKWPLHAENIKQLFCKIVVSMMMDQ